MKSNWNLLDTKVHLGYKHGIDWDWFSLEYTFSEAQTDQTVKHHNEQCNSNVSMTYEWGKLRDFQIWSLNHFGGRCIWWNSPFQKQPRLLSNIEWQTIYQYLCMNRICNICTNIIHTPVHSACDLASPVWPYIWSGDNKRLKGGRVVAMVVQMGVQTSPCMI